MTIKVWSVIAVPLALAANAAGAPAAAHPHAWILAETAVRFDQEGRATGIYQRWLFDRAYSAYTVEGMDADGDGQPDQAALDDLAAGIMENLADYDHFTEAAVGGQALGFGAVAEKGARMTGDRLELTFVLPFAEPAAVGAGLSYSVYDPSYYVEIVHADGADAVTLDGAPEGCGAELRRPNFNAEATQLASALDASETGPSDLGALFADIVTVACD